MTSLPMRDQVNDELLTPKNSALIIIDYQPVQVQSIGSMDRPLLVNNIVGMAKIALAYDVPIMLSTVNVKTGLNRETIPQLRSVLAGLPSYDRTTINAWEDREFLEAVEDTGRKKLLMTALWTEACLTFPSLDAMREGYEVYPVVDAVGGTSAEAHRTALERLVQKGAHPVTWNQVLCELQRDWSRTDTRQKFIQLFIEIGGTAGLQFTFDVAEKAAKAAG